MTQPAIGTYVRPVGLGSYAYCLRIEAVVDASTEWDDEPWTQWQGRRFGLDEHNEPCEDGGSHDMHFISNLVPVLPGVWREPHATWSGCPRYWREMGPRGQLEMFA